MSYAIGYQNLELTVSPQVNGLVPKYPITLYIWSGQTVTSGVVTSTYNSPISLLSSAYQENDQKIRQVYGINVTDIVYRFYLQSNIVTGINRPGQRAQDYIMWNSQRFNIIAVFDTFNTGWKYVLGIQDTGD